MNERRNRRLSGVVGAFLLLVSGGGIALLGTGGLEVSTFLVQVTLIGLAGVFDIVAATDTGLTDRWAWYRWSGAGNVLLGLSLPLGLAGSGSLFFFLLTAVGGVSLAAMGIDMLAFHGKYTRGERLDHNAS
ncbi:hypothetical protein HALLA_17415 [Halostagnicola larsenii XH-48]|uniref:Uncharacterized protein n=1 Tax=Halostagnicola larsenii XH-48 TaxID=797299 RepID=W0JV31_9EURY|nr:hypothetical protein [Halostagnicola larsenii]AHG01125.1 hypothetical protein HALLA_17415 [Halostagnicola larsenii XH-48]